MNPAMELDLKAYGFLDELVMAQEMKDAG